jgi:hypothetical protein
MKPLAAMDPSAFILTNIRLPVDVNTFGVGTV